MADESDTGSIQSSQSEQGAEKKTFEESRFYALYIYCPKRSRSTSDEPDVSNSSEDGNMSLSVAATNLSATAETDLRKALSQRLVKVPSAPSEGNFLSVGLSSNDETSSSAVCYYCLLNAGVWEMEQNETAAPTRQYVVCFISFLDMSLDLFRPELDQYTVGIVKLLDAETSKPGKTDPSESPVDSSAHQGKREIQVIKDQEGLPYFETGEKLSMVDSSVKEYLERWHDVVLEYLARCVNRLGTSVHYLMYAALLDAELTVKGFSKQEETDIHKFVKSCSLSSLVQQLQSDQPPQGGSKSDSDLLLAIDSQKTTLKPLNATLSAKDNVVLFDVEGYPSTCQFCKLATEHLMSADAKNISKIKETLESVKLAFIHNLNKLKRFLKQAETDHYALFRSLIYLKKSGSGDLLLRYVHLEASPDTSKILSVLKEFINSKGQALV